MTKTGFKSGYLSIVGRPNVGKSTLLNRLVGQEIAIITPKPQTTRNRILGIKNLAGAQLIFLDTPGIHKTKSLAKVNKFMVETALLSLKEADIVIFMVDATHSLHPGDKHIIESLKQIKKPVILVVNKVDLVKKESLLPLIKDYNSCFQFKEIVPVSALQGLAIDSLTAVLLKMLPFGPCYFPEDMVTDLPERFMVKEIIRKKIIGITQDEIPYCVAVSINEFKERKENITYIGATIWVERNSQKGIVVGKKGIKLKEIGKSARIEIEKLLHTRVYLELWVKVKENWRKKENLLKELIDNPFN